MAPASHIRVRMCRVPGQRRRGFTLIELLMVTVILSILAMLVARPIAKAREKAMVAAAEAQVRHALDAAQQYQIVQGRLPTSVAELSTMGYRESADVKICHIDYPGDASYLLIQARHRGTGVVVQGLFEKTGTSLQTLTAAEASPACVD